MSAEERGWWDALKDEEILNNTAGNPPYDVDAVIDFLDLVLDPGFAGTVIDIGCGTGRLTKRYAERRPGQFFVGLDAAPNLIAIASEDLSDAANVAFINVDGTTLHSYSNQGRMGAAYSVTVFQHMPHAEVQLYIEQIYEMLRPGRRFAFTWSEGDEDTFLCHQTNVATVERWLLNAGFEKFVHLICTDHPEGWRWTVAEKGES